jgi:hypothetical protein
MNCYKIPPDVWTSTIGRSRITYLTDVGCLRRRGHTGPCRSESREWEEGGSVSRQRPGHELMLGIFTPYFYGSVEEARKHFGSGGRKL